jgi:hypothetical protein
MHSLSQKLPINLGKEGLDTPELAFADLVKMALLLTRW